MLETLDIHRLMEVEGVVWRCCGAPRSLQQEGGSDAEETTDENRRHDVQSNVTHKRIITVSIYT